MHTNQKIATKLHSACIRILRWVRRVDAEGSLPAAQLSALSVIMFRPGITASELAEEEQVSGPSMTRTVDALVAAGMVIRARDARDRRRVAIAPTRGGRRFFEEAAGRRVQLLAERLEGLSAKEREILERAAALMLRLTASQ